jgi:hypothetical protein
MQFTVLIEFLVPGLATALLTLALIPCNALPPLPLGMPTGDTVTALLLLAVSYPIGILANFPLYQIQRIYFTPKVHRAIIAEYKEKGFDLSNLYSQHFSVKTASTEVPSREALRDVFSLLRASVFAHNISRLNSQYLYHQSVQRLARGMLVPLLLAGVWVSGSHTTAKVLLVLVSVLGLLCAMSCWLLWVSIREEDDEVARYFIVLEAKPTEKRAAANPAAAPDALRTPVSG